MVSAGFEHRSAFRFAHDTGEVLGTALRTFCLGLWKLGILQDQALDYVGTELIDFDIPLVDVRAIGTPQHSANNKSISSQLCPPTPSTSHS